MSTAAEKTALAEGQGQLQTDKTSIQPGSTIGDHTTLADHQGTAKKGFRFWAIIASLLVATFLSALDLTGE